MIRTLSDDKRDSIFYELTDCSHACNRQEWHGIKASRGNAGYLTFAVMRPESELAVLCNDMLAFCIDLFKTRRLSFDVSFAHLVLAVLK